MTQGRNHQATVAPSAYDEARHRIAELKTPGGMVLGDVIARLVLDSGAVRPAAPNFEAFLADQLMDPGVSAAFEAGRAK